MRTQKTKTLVECALMVALAIVLSFITVYKLPQGGSITAVSMMPLVLASFRHGPKWGLLTGLVFGLIQMLMGFENVMYCTSFGAMVICILLDYLLAYSVMGLACVFGKVSKNRATGVAVGTVVTGLLRYLCSFLSGILIWKDYAPDTMPVWLYSLTYNGSYMIPEIILTAIAAVLVMKVLDKQLPVKVG